MEGHGEPKTTTDTKAMAEDERSLKRNGKYNLRRKTLANRQDTEEKLKSPKLPKPKSRPPPLSKYRRKTANSRERGRMQEINIAFQNLQTVLPVQCLAQVESKSANLTKITTLRLAVNYIAALRGVLGDEKSLQLKTEDDQTKPDQRETKRKENVETEKDKSLMVKPEEKGWTLNNNVKDDVPVTVNEENAKNFEMETDHFVCTQNNVTVNNIDHTASEQDKMTNSKQCMDPISPEVSKDRTGSDTCDKVDDSQGILDTELSNLDMFKKPYVTQPCVADVLTSDSGTPCCRPLHGGNTYNDNVDHPYRSFMDTSFQPQSSFTVTYDRPPSSPIETNLRRHGSSTDTFTQPQISGTETYIKTHNSSSDSNIKAQSSATDISIKPHNVSTDTYPIVYSIEDHFGDVDHILMLGDHFGESQNGTNMDTFDDEALTAIQTHSTTETADAASEKIQTSKTFSDANIESQVTAMEVISDNLEYPDILKAVMDNQFR